MRLWFDVPDEILTALLEPVPVPVMARIRHRLPTPPAIRDVRHELAHQLDTINALNVLRPGQRVAVAVGSRGIGRLQDIVAELVAGLRQVGAEPFIVPAMGSHGGATAEGQRQVLAHLGITPEGAGAPVISQMETAVLGHTPEGVPVRMDRVAAAADWIVPVARVKPHTAFRGPYESGVAKMIAIGLGKQAGAALTHARGFGHMATMIPAMARVALARTPIPFAVCVLENAQEEPFKLQVLPASRILDREPALLDEARRAMPRLPFERFDVLVIDCIGKNISGDGADPNITGRYPTPFATGGPDVSKQVVLDLSAASEGNANGVGTADFTTVRLARKVNLASTYPNALTSTVPGPVRLPMILPSDQRAIQAAILTCNAVDREPQIVRIRDTLHIEELWASPPLLRQAADRPDIDIVAPAEPFPFDVDGNLTDLSAATRQPVAPGALHDTW
jgi:hypothetical protein